MTRAGSVAVFFMLLMAACTFGDGSGQEAKSDSKADDASLDAETTTTTQPCSPSATPLSLTEAPGSEPSDLIALSEAVFDCQPTAVVFAGSHPPLARFAAQTAIDEGAPLLLVAELVGVPADPGDVAAIAAELERLQVDRVLAIGLDKATERQLGIDSVETVSTPVTTAPATPSTTNAPTTTPPDPADTTTTPETATSEANADESSTTITPSTIPPTTAPAFNAIPGPGLPSPDGPVVIFKPGDEAAAYLALPAIVLGGGEVAVADPADVDAMRELIAGRSNVFLSGDLTPTENWQVNLATSSNELFGGGTQMFPDRRIIAYYGNPLTFRLGLLGETDPDRAVERVSERAELYNAEGLPPALPGFEIIVTVAATQAGDDGNYSNEMDIEVVRPWIDAAMANDVSVILDLQPGRTDFVTQAKLYEEFLRLPNVGLALDPEWRLKPDQRHLRQIGTVGADEINAVIDYLTSLVHEEDLPQKVLILHQFNSRMLPERELVNTPPEIAVVVHVDGQGSLGSKYGTWNAMLEAPTGPDQKLWWGWKNFIDEDFPTATPRQVNAVEPLPFIVTYQ